MSKSLGFPSTHANDKNRSLPYVPKLAGRGFEQVTIQHVWQMTSGLDFNESYSNPFGEAATYYYGRKLRKYIGKMT